MFKKNAWIKALFAITALMLLTGCGMFEKEVKPIPPFTAKAFDTSKYDSKLDNFLILFDASSSMVHKYYGVRNFEIGQELVNRLNATIPELGQQAGLRSFGHAPEVSKNKTELFYGMERYSTQNLDAGFKKISAPGGVSRIDLALGAVEKDLEKFSDKKNALIIITDNYKLPTETLPSLQALKSLYGSSLCIYVIFVGDVPAAAAEHKGFNKLLDCGGYFASHDLLSSAAMADFVEDVFLKEKPAPVVKQPAPVKPKKDSDGDGVYDDDDKCPGTPIGAKVNAFGCWTLDQVLFDFDKADIKPSAHGLLDDVVMILEKNPSMTVTLQGHTDNVGTPEYNMALSIKRAQAVKTYLAENGIDADRMTTEGFGFTMPVSFNDSEFGRSLNRRVDIKPAK